MRHLEMGNSAFLCGCATSEYVVRVMQKFTNEMGGSIVSGAMVTITMIGWLLGFSGWYDGLRVGIVNWQP